MIQPNCLPMSEGQNHRACELYRSASIALRALCEESLNLSASEIGSVCAARSELEYFDWLRSIHPKEGGAL